MEEPDQFAPARRSDLALAQHNVRVLQAITDLEPGATLTPDQRELLADWAGWGPMAKAFRHHIEEPGWRDVAAELGFLLDDKVTKWAREATTNAYYTPPAVTALVWRLLRGLGFTGGRVLEPGCGHGGFIASAPADLDIQWTGIELDPVTARIAALLHPDARIVNRAIQKTPLRIGGFDAAVGNVPFADVTPYDPAAPEGLTLHNYCIWKALQAVRPGGIIALVTSRYTLDAGYGSRDALHAAGGILLGAVRLPSRVWASYGTSVVADLLVLRRADYDTEPPPWPASDTMNDLRTSVSRYFTEHPGQVIGTMQARGGAMYGQTLEVTFPGDDGQLEQAANEAVERIVTFAAGRGWQWRPPTPEPTVDDGPADGELLLPDGRKEGSFHLTDDGGVVQIRNGWPQPVIRPRNELKALIRLRDAVLALLEAEADHDRPDHTLAKLRAAAHREYELYVKWYGFLHRGDLRTGPPDPDTGEPTFTRARANLGGFRADPDYVTVMAIEQYDDATGTAKPAPLLERRVNRRPTRPTRAGSPEEAIALCLDEHGRLDMGTVARLLDTSVIAAIDQLGDRVFKDPERNEWVPAEEYLSGNVRAKLAAAADAASTDPYWARNVDALTAVQPEDLGPAQIRVRLGAPWLPSRYVVDFLEHMFGHRIPVTHEPVTATWAVQYKGWEVGPTVTVQWGTSRVSAYRLIELALNGQAPVVYDEKLDDRGNVVGRTRSRNETLRAEEKQRALQERFAQWVWEDPKRADALAKLYNNLFNAVRLRHFDGSHLTFPGLIEGFEPYQSQRDMVWRIVSTPAALCGFAVGAGKTAVQILAAATMKRMGLVNKPLIVVPNHLLEQTAAEAARLLPAAHILMVTKDDLTKERRKAFAARVATEDWDLLVMTITQFTALPLSPHLESEFLAEQLERYEATLARKETQESRVTVKKLAKAVMRMREQYAALRDRRTDDGLAFDLLGIDYLLMDESHLFKSLGAATRMDGFSLPASKRATDLHAKLMWLRRRNPSGRCGTFFTGTPISNSLAEIHVILSYLVPDRLVELGLDSFDAFAGQFIQWESKIEVAPDGSGFRMHRRPARFVNVPALRGLLGECADIRTATDLDLDRPEVEYVNVVAEADEQHTMLNAELVERADGIRSGAVKPHKDNMLAVCNTGRAGALWLPLVGLAHTGPGKLDMAVANIAREYHAHADQTYPDLHGDPSPVPGAFQVVFCDLGTPKGDDHQVYGHIRTALVSAGIPAGKISYIHEANTDAQRAALFARCRGGDVAVLLGSTEKLGTGVNIQHRLAAVHHLDAPWRPADVEQREGRALRPGNHNPVVRVYRYVTEGTFDAYMWQALHRKAEFIRQILTGDITAIEVEDISTIALDYGHVKALATGQPLLLELAEVQAEVARLRELAAGHTREQQQLTYTMADQLAAARAADRNAATLRSIAQHASPDKDLFTGYPHRHLIDPGQIADKIAETAQAAAKSGTHESAGQYRGLPVSVRVERGHRKTPDVVVMLRGRWGDEFSELRWPRSVLKPGQRVQMVDALDDLIGRAAAAADTQEGYAAQFRAGHDQAAALAGAPFAYAAELDAALARRAEIEAELADQVDGGGEQAAA